MTDSTSLASNVAQIDLDAAIEAEALTIIVGGGYDALTGGAGDDYLDGRGWMSSTVAPAATRSKSGGTDDLIYGRSGFDIITGEGGQDTIYGQDGADEIDGGSSDDWIEGRSSNNIIFGGFGEGSIFGDSGDDLINGGDGNHTLTGATGGDFTLSGDGDNVLNPEREDDILFGGAGNDTFDLEGNDYAHGSFGDDLFKVDTGTIGTRVTELAVMTHTHDYPCGSQCCRRQ